MASVENPHVVTVEREIASRVEAHEAAVWAECAAAAASLPGNPLDVVIEPYGPVPLIALRAVDRPDLNRVVALGAQHPARAHDLDAISSFYAGHGQQCFRIEVTPLAQPSDLAAWISARGLVGDVPTTYKLWHAIEPPLVVQSHLEVRRLDPIDADKIAALNVVAWGTWGTPLLHHWFAASVGHAGVHHYGIFDEHRLVATGALFVDGGLGWFGFDATHPRHQGGRLRQAISAMRLRDAAALGCEIVHAESAIPLSSRAARDGWRLLYEKRNYSTAPAASDTRAVASELAR